MKEHESIAKAAITERIRSSRTLVFAPLGLPFFPHIVVALALVFITPSILAVDTPEGSADPVSGELGSDLTLSVDPFTGGVSYSLPIVVPPGRQGSEPKLALRYGSGGGNGWCGIGWSIGMGMIQRDTRYGVPVDFDDPNDNDPNQYDDSRGFVAALGATGSRLVLVDDVNNVYRAETDQAFLKYIFDKDNNQWIVVDKSGNKYYFGESSDGRMVHPDFVSQDGKNTFLWALEKIQDKNGNRTLIDYTADANQIYLDKISYNGNVNSPTISETHTIDFTLEDRNDVSLSYATGYRVETKKRLSEIDIEMDDQQVRRYVLSYDYSPSSLRSLMMSVTMYGADDVNSLPPITFDYSELEFEFEDLNDFGDLEAPEEAGYSWNYPNVGDGYGPGSCAIMQDIDGDGLPDRVMREDVSAPPGGWSKFKVQLNTGDGFAEMQDWGTLDSPEFSILWNIPYGSNLGTCATLVDINGDGLSDRVMREDYSKPVGGWSKYLVQLNNGAGFDEAIDWEDLDSPVDGVCWWNPHGLSYGTCASLMDINGDGLPDRVMRNGNTPPFNEFAVQINNGTGFNGMIEWGNLQSELQNNAYWSSPQYNSYGSNHVDMLDINGDGLVDRVWRPSSANAPYDNFRIQFNTGYGFADVEEWDIQSSTTTWPYNCPYGKSGSSIVTMLLDITGDGLPDRVTREAASMPVEGWTQFEVQINTGSGFSEPVYFTNLDAENAIIAIFYSPAGFDYSVMVNTMMDLNGDGLLDRVMGELGSTPDTFKIQLNKGPVPDLLTKVTGALGGTAEVTYKPSTQYDNEDHMGKHRLPFPVQTVDTLTLSDGFGNSHTTTYEYERGMFDFDSREFRGFGKVTITDPCATQSVTYFHQGGGYDDPNIGEYLDPNSVAKRGMPYRVEVYGSDANLYSITLNKVEETEVESGTGWTFAYVAQTIKMDYEGTENYRAKVRQSTYDPNTGNILISADIGEVNDVNVADHTFTDIGDDSLYIHTTYDTFTDPNILNKIASTKTTTDFAGANILKQIVFDYNDTTGNVVESKEWLDTISDYITSTTFEYDQYGNRTKTTDPEGYVTETQYDDDYAIYPVDVNTAGFVTTAVYDANSGLPLEQTDVMGITTKNVYDNFFRMTDVYVSREPEGDPNLWLTHLEYSMDGITSGITENYVYQVHEGYEAYTYNDGLGRIVQTRVLAEPAAPNDCRVSEVFYDPRGNVYFESLPYFSDGNDFTIWDDNTDGVLTEFDALGRAYKVTPPTGDVNSPTGPSYTEFRDGNDLWVTVSTDAEGNKKKQYFDAQGRVIKLVEVITDGNDIETRYDYDDLGRLIKTYDDANNVIEVSYDSLGRKTDSNDPDMGYWTYKYDDLGRLTEQEGARGNVVENVYDPNIDRISQKKIYDVNDTLVETITYTYDSGEAGYTVYKGLLFRVEDGEGWQKFGYDSRGRVIKSTRHITAKSKSYTTYTSYDDADRVTEVIYPDNRATIEYSYDDVGHLIKVESTSGVPDSNEVFYQPEGFNVYNQLTGVDFGNGVESRYEFYTYSKRLKRIVTYTDVNDPNTYLQDLTYTFDKLSNIKSITDDVYSGSANGSLSDIVYDDLYRLKSLYSGGADANMTYSYNTLGNITYNSEGAGSSYTYGGSRPHAVTSAYGKSYSYDACGNMTARGSDTLTYDARNRLAKIVKDSNDIEFGYSADGARLYKKFNSTVTQVWIGDIYEEKDDKILCHVFAGDKLIATFEPASALSRFIDRNPLLKESYEYASLGLNGLFGGGRTPFTLLGFGLLAGIYFGIRYRKDTRQGYSFFYKSPYRQLFGFIIIVSVFVATTPGICYAGTPTYDPVFYYYHSDHLGSSNIMTDRDGDLVQHYGYLLFGNERYQDNTQAYSVTNRYTGQHLDEETGLYFYGSRYYDPELARFIQPDSIVPDASSQGLNRYTYCNNNPLLFVDPSGHASNPSIFDAYYSSLPMGNNGIAASDALGSLLGPAGITSVITTGGTLAAVVTGGDPAAPASSLFTTSQFTLFSSADSSGVYIVPLEDSHFDTIIVCLGEPFAQVGGNPLNAADPGHNVMAELAKYKDRGGTFCGVCHSGTMDHILPPDMAKAKYAWAPTFAIAGAAVLVCLTIKLAFTYIAAGSAALTPEGLLVTGSNGLGSLAASQAVLGTASISTAGGGITVYRAIDATGRVIYVGITNNIVRRGGEQLRNLGIRIQAIPGLENLNRVQGIGVEQALINLHGLQKNGGTLLNKINSIATQNPVYESMFQYGNEMLKSINYPGAGGG